MRKIPRKDDICQSVERGRICPQGIGWNGKKQLVRKILTGCFKHYLFIRHAQFFEKYLNRHRIQHKY